MSVWPSMACTARSSAPRSSRWVAKLWRSLCGEIGLVIPAEAAAGARRVDLGGRIDRDVPLRSEVPEHPAQRHQHACLRADRELVARERDQPREDVSRLHLPGVLEPLLFTKGAEAREVASIG